MSLTKKAVSIAVAIALTGCATAPVGRAWLGLLVPLAALLVVHRRG